MLKKISWVIWLLPALLLWASFPPMGESADIVFALAPLMWFTRRRTVAQSWKLWFLNGLIFNFASLAWMPAIVKNGGPWPLVVLGWAGLAAYCALYYGLYGALAAYFWRWASGRGYRWRMLAIFIVEPVLWCGLEIVRSRMLGGFAWNQLGVAAVNGGFGAAAGLGGVYLCSALVILVNGVIASVAERMWKWNESGGWPTWTRPIETVLPVLLAAGIHFGAAGLVARPADEIKPLKVALVQRNFPCVFQERDSDPMDVYRRLLGNVAPLSPDLVVLPESALAEFGQISSFVSRRFLDEVMKFAKARAVLAGGGRLADGREYNSAVLRTVDGIESVYDKVHLVPFGEFIPGDKLIPALQRFAPVGSCTPGELKTLDFDGIGIGVAICYEDTDSAQIRQLAESGASLLVFITNDSWFSYSDEAVQHAWQSVARAIETGLTVVRVGNSGISGIVSAGGAPKWISRDGVPLADSQATMFEIVPVPVRAKDSRHTLYVRLGDKPIFIAFLLLITGLILIKYTTIYEKRRTLSM